MDEIYNRKDNNRKEYKKIYAVIVAAGSGRRMGMDVPKQLLPYMGRTVLETAVDRFASDSRIDGIAVVSPGDGSLDEIYSELLSKTESKKDCGIMIVRGGAERSDSVQAGLEAVRADAASAGTGPDEVMVLIHDAARPGVTQEIIDCNIEMMAGCDALVTAVRSVDSVRMLDPGKPYSGKSDSGMNGSESNKSNILLKETMTYPIMNSIVVDRDLVYNVQTPQTFRLSDILEAYEIADRDGFTGTDDASVAEHAGIRVSIVPGSRSNSKITTREDISMTTRVGTGYDVHRLVPERALILCGTPVPWEKGLDGHSDADVAVHALMDALLGAAALGDIGRHFPDNDDRYKGADSMRLLAEVRDMLKEAGVVAVNNVDITIIAQAPKLAPYIDQMRANISETLGISLSAVSVKATTEEGLGFTGRGEGIAAIATCAICSGCAPA